MPYCIPSSKRGSRFLRMTARTASMADRRSAGNSARYCWTVVALLCMAGRYAGLRPCDKSSRSAMLFALLTIVCRRSIARAATRPSFLMFPQPASCIEAVMSRNPVQRICGRDNSVVAARVAIERSLLRLRRGWRLLVHTGHHPRQLLAARRLVRGRAVDEPAPRLALAGAGGIRRQFLLRLSARDEAHRHGFLFLRRKHAASDARGVVVAAVCGATIHAGHAQGIRRSSRIRRAGQHHAGRAGRCDDACVGSASARPLERSWEVWWASCAMPVLVLTPFIVVWFSSAGPRPAASIPARRIPEAVLLLGVLVFAVWYVMMKNGRGHVSLQDVAHPNPSLRRHPLWRARRNRGHARAVAAHGLPQCAVL